MYEYLLNKAYELNEAAMFYRREEKISHERFVDIMGLVSLILDKAEKVREKEI